MDNAEKPIESRIMPVISPDKYIAVKDSRSITPAQKAEFLEVYYRTGNKSLAAKTVGISTRVAQYAATNDPVFAIDLEAVKNAMKHNLEQTMYQNGLKEKGYMDRITWLRKNFPKEYNPAYVDKDTNPADAIKELSTKLDNYDLIPKNKVIDIKEAK